MLIGWWYAAQAAGTLTVGNAQGHPADTVDVRVALTTTDPAAALQLVMPLDAQLTYVEGSASLVSGRLGATDHQLSASFAAGKLTLLLYSPTNSQISVGSGDILSFRLKLGREPASYPMLPTVVLSDRNAQQIQCAVNAGSATIEAPKIQLSASSVDYGHVPIRSHYSGSIIVTNVGNAPLHINSISSSSSSWTPAQSELTLSAGTSQQVDINYSPMNHGAEEAVLTIVSDAINGRKQVSLAADPYSVNELHLSAASGEAGSEVVLTLSMDNMEEIVAAQCEIVLPEGVEYVAGSACVSADRADGHVASGTIRNRTLSIIAYSPQNKAFKAISGNLLQFRLLLGGSGGSFSLELQNAVLSNVRGENMLSDKMGNTLRVFCPEISSSDSLPFGRIPVEHVFPIEYTIRNVGESELIIPRVLFTDSVHFSLTDVLPIAVAPGEAASLNILYTPSVVGDFESDMYVYTNDPMHKMVPVHLSGTVYESNYMQMTGEMEDNVYSVALDLRNTTPVVALQADLHWVESPALMESCFLLSDRSSSHALSFTDLGEGSYRLFIYSLQNHTFSGNAGELFRINLPQGNINATTLIVDNIILSTISGDNCSTQRTLSHTVLSGTMGDVNDDGLVTVTDVVAVIDYTLEHPIANFSVLQADMNGDGAITVADAVLIIHQIMND